MPHTISSRHHRPTLPADQEPLTHSPITHIDRPVQDIDHHQTVLFPLTRISQQSHSSRISPQQSSHNARRHRPSHECARRRRNTRKRFPNRLRFQQTRSDRQSQCRASRQSLADQGGDQEAGRERGEEMRRLPRFL